MATLTKHQFSEVSALSGRRFVISASTASGADVFHVVPSNSTYTDELWVYAHNFSAGDIAITFMLGLTGLPSTQLATVREGVTITIPFQSGRALVFDGSLLNHSLSAAVYATTGDTCSIDGFVNRIAT